MKAASWLVLTLSFLVGSTPAARADSPAADSRPASVREGSGGSSGETRSASARQREMVRRASELRRQTRQRLRHEALTEGVENRFAIDGLIDHYIELQVDPSLTDDHRRELSGKVRSRLIRVRDRLVKEAKRRGDADAPDRTHLVRSDARTGSPAAGATEDDRAKPLVRRAGDQAARAVARTLHQVLAQQGAAGPAGAAAGGMLGGVPPLAGDYGDDLVDLIQTVIAPSTWERNGGLGSIYYYRPLRVLVIRQTSEVHEQVGRAMEGLRRAGN